jgi:hypothetical protein
MKHVNVTILILITLLTFCISPAVFAQSECDDKGGNQDGGYGKGGDSTLPDEDNPLEWIIRRVHSQDPNDILGPHGYLDKRWVAAKDRLSFRIRFENNPQFATAPAQNIFIRQAIDPRININSLRLGSFGFGHYTFPVPDNTSFYTTRLDVRDSLKIFVDVIAGIDITKHEIFWSFKSIDPLTGRAPEDALVGILPVNDTAINRFNDTLQKPGEGYVTYLINTKPSVATGDTVSAKAIIVFDTNEEIPTNTWVNSIDAVAPTSKALAAQVNKDTITINWSGQDDNGGTGIREYALYVSENNSPFTLYKDNITGNATPFTGTRGMNYGFFTLATDQVGNTEALKKTAEVTASLTNCQEEICNGVDDDCDGQTDEGFTVTYYLDADGDGFGALGSPKQGTTCNPPTGYVLNSTDCNDNNAAIHPGATEICNNQVDDDCDGLVDEGCGIQRYYNDVDKDGWGRNEGSRLSATPIPGWVLKGGDCADFDATIYPGAPELANGRDDNCNGQADEGLPMLRYYIDVDKDGYGRNENSRLSAIPLDGYVLLNGDCADFDATIYPGAPELANGRDDNCNGQVDEGLPMLRYYLDVDKDGYGRNEGSKLSAIPLSGYVLLNGDCADFDATIYPGAPELANGRDDNCNGQADEGLPMLRYYQDVDKDGYGRDAGSRLSAIPLAGYVLLGGDCHDYDPKIYPGAPEIINGKDDNCNGVIDEVIITTFTNTRKAGMAADTVAVQDFNVVAKPVPSYTTFQVYIYSPEKLEKVTINVHDNIGRLIETRVNLSPGQVITLGAGYAKGFYMIEARQGKRIKTIKVIKL